MKNALVIGATGLLGYGVTQELSMCGWNVRAIGNNNVSSKLFHHSVRYECGDFYDESFLKNMLLGIDKVFFFLSSTFPSTSSDSLELEISRSLSGLDYLLRKMRDLGIKEIVFPSSGGTVYGNVVEGFAKEDSKLSPTSPYGVGKKMCEEVLQFYAQFGISATILRVGNVYGSTLIRKTSQGVIDVFVQKAMDGETATIWGDALSSVRDYIFVDDFAKAVSLIGNFKAEGVEVFNLGSGVGTSLQEIVNIINEMTNNSLNIEHINNNSTSSIKRIVLDMSKFKNHTGWEPSIDIKTGIAKTIERKKF